MADGDRITGVAKPESPTTARPLDFDDESQESGVTLAATPTSSQPQSTLGTGTGNASAPQKPPRPLSPRHQAEKDLKEAFPNIDDAVIRAVLVASGGNMERAFHALLSMSDPNAQIEDELPPAMPPRPSLRTSTSQRQLEQDELYARQLAEHYNSAAQSRSYPRSGWNQEPRLPRPQRETGLKPNELYDDREHSFFDDDLPVIKENIRKGFLETQSKVNAWVQNLKKKLDGEDTDDEYGDTPPRPADGYYHQGFGEGASSRTRRSADRDRYDADPQLISDNFSSLQLRDNEVPPPRPPRPSRPAANPDLFTTKSPSPDRRKVSFQEGPPEEISDLYSAGSGPKNRSASSSTKSSKWQPLSSVEPSPIGDNDPFSLGDSDDEKEAKNKDSKPEEADRTKKAADEASAGESAGSAQEKANSNKTQ